MAELKEHIGTMFKEYEKLFDLYLGACKLNYENQSLSKCCEQAESMHWKLLGMLDLLFHAGKITEQKLQEETSLILQTFSNINHSCVEKLLEQRKRQKNENGSRQ